MLIFHSTSTSGLPVSMMICDWYYFSHLRVVDGIPKLAKLTECECDAVFIGETGVYLFIPGYRQTAPGWSVCFGWSTFLNDVNILLLKLKNMCDNHPPSKSHVRNKDQPGLADANVGQATPPQTSITADRIADSKRGSEEDFVALCNLILIDTLLHLKHLLVQRCVASWCSVCFDSQYWGKCSNVVLHQKIEGRLVDFSFPPSVHPWVWWSDNEVCVCGVCEMWGLGIWTLSSI